MKKAGKTSLWTKLFSIVLILFTSFVLLDTFIIPRAYVIENDSVAEQSVNTASSVSSTADAEKNTTESTSATVTENSYSDGNISITITKYREYDTDIYVADVTVTDASYLKTAFADSTYGKNITEKTSVIADESGAILAINGDYYGAQNSGYVIRNGKIYRDTISASSQEDLVIYEDGSFEIVTEGSVSASELLAGGAVHVLSFGPGLIENGEISVTESEEVDKAKTSNPRTAIGQISDLHYVMVVSDGRTSKSAGLSLQELAEFMQGLGVTTAYNLDGGGSSTMVFNGTVINNPTTNGTSIKERSVSDIVCFAD
ncbi:MAG: phosphodiester glycosidase family protein [Clostridia bacterium]|nr:phosphodiester glycosidase family protein [Clostridia bacterium]